MKIPRTEKAFRAFGSARIENSRSEDEKKEGRERARTAPESRKH